MLFIFAQKIICGRQIVRVEKNMEICDEFFFLKKKKINMGEINKNK